MFFKVTKKSNIIKFSLSFLLLVFGLVSCFEDAEPDGIIRGTGRVPAVFSFEPDTAEPGQEVTLTGKGFTNTTSVTFNGTEGTIISNTDDTVVVTVPEGATSGKIAITTNTTPTFRGDTGVFVENFTIFIPGAPIVNEISPIAGQPGDLITLTGSQMNAVTSLKVGDVEVNDLTVSKDEITFTIAEGSLPGLNTLEFVSSVGPSNTNTEENPFFVYEILESITETFDADENVLSHGFDREVAFSGVNTVLDPSAPFIPESIDNNFYYVGGTSDTSDSGAFIGLIGNSQKELGFYADFFNNEESQDITNVYFNMDVNFGDVPVDYTGELAGIRMRFDVGYDLDSDGSSTDEFMEYRPTLEDLDEKGFVANADGWYSISIRMDQFENSGPRGNVGTWDVYQLEDLTRIAIAARRGYDGPFALSIDNISITKGRPINPIQ